MLVSAMKRVSRDISIALQETDAELRLYERTHIMTFMDCNECGRRHPLSAKRCRPCGNSGLQEARCTRDSRVSDYFSALRLVGLWPSVQPFETLSVSELLVRIRQARDENKHKCAAELNCPLKARLDRLILESEKICERSRTMSLESVLSEQS